MRYSHNRNYRDSMMEEVNKLMKKIDSKPPKCNNWFIKLLKKIFNKIKLCMSYLKLK